MARARNIKPAFFTNELLGVADPMVSLTFAGLWCLADKIGILEDRPLRIKAELFPYRDSLDVNGYLTELSRLGFIVRYKNGEKCLIQVCNFRKHQSPHHTEKAKGFPLPSDPKSLIWNGNGYGPVAEQDADGERKVQERSDSLIPDSLIPDTGFTDSVQEVKEPSKKETKTKAAIPVSDMVRQLPGLSSESANEYLAYRKAKKAPLTPGAWKAIAAEIAKSGMVPDDAVNMAMARNWQGFESAWISGVHSSQGSVQPRLSKQEQIEAANQRVVDEIIARQSGGDQVGFDLGDPIVIEGEVIHAH